MIVRLSWIMSTPDETKPWFMEKRGGTPPIVISSDTYINGNLPMKQPSKHGVYENPGLTLQ